MTNRHRKTLPGVTLQTGEQQFTFLVRGSRFTSYHYDHTSPEFVTLNVPEGQTVLRCLHIQHGNIQRMAFGTEGAEGRIVVEETTARRGTYSAGFRQSLAYLAPTGERLLTEHRTVRIVPGPCDGCLLDMALHFWATEDSKIVLGRTASAFLTAQVASPLLPSGGGQIRNSLGEYGIEALNGRGAAWVGAIGVVQSETVGFVWLDHPENPSHPTLWQVASDGWLSPSIFAWRSLELAPRESLHFRYRLLLHRGYVEQHWADARLTEFAQAPL